MQWDDGPNAGFCKAASGAEPWLPLSADWPVRNVEAQRCDPRLDAHPCIGGCWRCAATTTPSASGDTAGVSPGIDGVFAYERFSDGATLRILLNFRETAHTIPLPDGVWTVLLSTAAGHAGEAVRGTIALWWRRGRDPADGVIEVAGKKARSAMHPPPRLPGEKSGCRPADVGRLSCSRDPAGHNRSLTLSAACFVRRSKAGARQGAFSVVEVVTAHSAQAPARSGPEPGPRALRAGPCDAGRDGSPAPGDGRRPPGLDAQDDPLRHPGDGGLREDRRPSARSRPPCPGRWCRITTSAS